MNILFHGCTSPLICECACLLAYSFFLIHLETYVTLVDGNIFVLRGYQEHYFVWTQKLTEFSILDARYVMV